ncbi:hypothetical protein RUM44_001394 [Polyplax serrata]|uniref:Spondin domain-containing protein n=1 Tax=Polyplax serrata TaxID=468196 RepID=A0ABR1AJW3_POLSC
MKGTFCLFLCFLTTVSKGHKVELLQEAYQCNKDDLVVYTLIFETHWAKDKFPKQYPENRPPAHWSKLIGMSHDENYELFRIGGTASEKFKLFAETGKTYLFGKENNTHVFDEFSTSSIKNGTGKTQVTFFVDGNHTMVSMAAKIIPSPDWFVGVDSLALCTEGSWLDSITIEGGPIDAGTDSGYTFTAPNWETEPQEIITKITSKYPKHPANSFYYPKLRDLPVIATFHIIKKKSYQLRRAFNDNKKQAPAKVQTDLNSSYQPQEDLTENEIERKNFTPSKMVKFNRFHRKRKVKKQGTKSGVVG